MFIRRINQIEKVGCDGQRQFVVRQFRAGEFLRQERGMSRCNCSGVVMRCWSCQRQLFQSESETSCQKPRPAERNSFKGWSRWTAGGSPPFACELSSFIFQWKL